MSSRTLYVGNDLVLLKSLQDSLKEYEVIRCSHGSLARTLIREIGYSLLLLDKNLSDMTGEELKRFIRSVMIYQQTPVLIPTASPESLVEVMTKVQVALFGHPKRNDETLRL